MNWTVSLHGLRSGNEAEDVIRSVVAALAEPQSLSPYNAARGRVMTRINFGAIDHYVGFQIHSTWRAIKKRMLVSGRRREGKVSRGSYSIPILIGLNPGVSPQELAKALHLDASKIAFFLKELEADGMVERTPSQVDGRRVELRLTPKGEELAEKARLASDVIERPISSVITPEEAAELIRILQKIQNAI